MKTDISVRLTLYLFFAMTFCGFLYWFHSFSPTEGKISRYFQRVSMELLALFFSYTYLIGSMAVYFLLTYNLECFRPRFYYEAMMALNGVCLASLIKLFFAQGRPYQIFTDVIPYDCECDYGMPSGHCFTAAMMGVLFYFRLTEWLKGTW